jgi:hypothetical protein
MTQGIVFQSSIEHKNYSFQQTLSTTTIAHNSVLQTLGKICSPYVYENSANGKQFAKFSLRFLYDTHFYFNILSLAAIISARWLHCHKHCKCYSIVSCSPLILIGAHFLSLEINQLHDLSLFKNMMKKQPCSEINAFKNSDPVRMYTEFRGIL